MGTGDTMTFLDVVILVPIVLGGLLYAIAASYKDK